MVAPAVEGIDLFNIAGHSISAWVPSHKTGTASHVRQPFCSQLEERLLLWLEYNPLVSCYARGDIGQEFATTYRLPTPKDAPFAIGYTFEGKPHHYLPDVVGTLTNGRLFIAEAGMEDDKRGDRNLAKTVEEQVQTSNSSKCTFSGVISIDLKRFLDSGILLVECPDCARTRTLSARNGVLWFPAHSKRKTRTPMTSQRWALEKTIWEVVGGERT